MSFLLPVKTVIKLSLLLSKLDEVQMKIIAIMAVAILFSLSSFAEEGTYEEVVAGTNSVTGLYKVSECADSTMPTEVKVKATEATNRRNKKKVILSLDLDGSEVAYDVKKFGEEKSIKTFSRKGVNCRIGSTKLLFESSTRYTTLEYTKKSMRYALCFIPTGKKQYLEQKLSFKKSKRNPTKLKLETRSGKKDTFKECTYEKVAELATETVN